jgi:hypothetical protein
MCTVKVCSQWFIREVQCIGYGARVGIARMVAGPSPV